MNWMSKKLMILGILTLALGLLATGCKKRVPPQETYTQPTTSDTSSATDASTTTNSFDTDLTKLQLEDIHYEFDSSELRTAAREILKGTAQYLSENPTMTLIVEGHCDERGTTEYNLALGQRRAEAAKRYLISLGVSDRRLKTVSYGEERPAVMGHDEEAWWQNRRAHFSSER